MHNFIHQRIFLCLKSFLYIIIFGDIITYKIIIMKKENLLSKAEMKKVVGGIENEGRCASQCEAIGSACGVAENPGKCGWVDDATCPGGGFGLCFAPSVS